MIEVVAAAIFLDGKLLCFQRGEAKYSYISYKFEFPGGKVEPGESLKTALTRELIEELELHVSIKDFVTTVEHQYPDFAIRMHCYICHAESYAGTMTDHIAFRRVSYDQLDDIDWIAADVPIRDALKKRFAHVFAG
jgi:8-oxo-dGTP diphosphatase